MCHGLTHLEANVEVETVSWKGDLDCPEDKDVFSCHVVDRAKTSVPQERRRRASYAAVCYMYTIDEGQKDACFVIIRQNVVFLFPLPFSLKEDRSLKNMKP